MVKSFFLTIQVLFLVICHNAFADAIHRDVTYSDEFKNSKLDIWLPSSKEPAAVIVFFHGGGFVGGNKGMLVFRNELLALRSKGVAIVSAGYPFLGDVGKTKTISKNGYMEILAHTELVIHFLKEQSDRYNLDMNRLIVSGGSAGAMISQYLTYATDLDISACIAIEQSYAYQPAIGIINKGEPPIFFFTFADETDRVHSPKYAKTIHEYCQKIGVESMIFGSSASGLPLVPDGENFISYTFKTVSQSWEN